MTKTRWVNTMELNYIIEGCDCVGKTTFIKEFVKKHPDYTVLKTGASKNKEEGLKDNLFLLNFLNDNTKIILDRGMLGECVYSPIKRKYYPEYMRALEKNLAPHNVLVLLTADLETVLNRFDDIFLTRDEIPLVLKTFHEEYLASGYALKILIDNTNKTPQECVSILENAFKELSE